VPGALQSALQFALRPPRPSRPPGGQEGVQQGTRSGRYARVCRDGRGSARCDETFRSTRSSERSNVSARPEYLAGTHSGIRAQALSSDWGLVDDFWFDRADRVLHVRNVPLACGDVEPDARRRDRGGRGRVSRRRMTPLEGVPTRPRSGLRPSAAARSASSARAADFALRLCALLTAASRGPRPPRAGRLTSSVSQRARRTPARRHARRSRSSLRSRSRSRRLESRPDAGSARHHRRPLRTGNSGLRPRPAGPTRFEGPYRCCEP
jgi:hypothetical protein